ncbi:MAG: hypothetical protein J6X27_06945 [Bacteroidaceae bacterium]|nr:hypothetical protein [Bacteroidaceae bacterium]
MEEKIANKIFIIKRGKLPREIPLLLSEYIISHSFSNIGIPPATEAIYFQRGTPLNRPARMNWDCQLSAQKTSPHHQEKLIAIAQNVCKKIIKVSEYSNKSLIEVIVWDNYGGIKYKIRRHP